MDDARRMEPSDGSETGSAEQDISGPHSAATGAVPAPRMSEERDDYPESSPRSMRAWRVIDSKLGIQWILQRRQGKSHSWRGNAYCRTREGLLSNIAERCGDADEAGLRVVERLPARHN
jgi:hypothetical protein